MSLFFAAYFLVIGVYLPFFPVWLEARGLMPQQIAIVVAVPMIMRVIFTPLLTLVSGRFQRQTVAIILFAWLGALPMVVLFLATDFRMIVAVVALSALFWNPVLPLAEALALAGVRRGSTAYGRMRLWGSWSFIVANLGGGLIATQVHPTQTIHIVAVAFITCAVAALFLREPEARAEQPRPGAPIDIGDAARLIALKPLVLALVGAALVQASHGVIYAFGSVHWAAKGLSYPLIGGLWAIGVVAEIILFAASASIGRTFGSLGLIALGGVAGVIRWSALSLDPGFSGLIMLQLLHAFTFGASHLGFVHLIGEMVPERHTATAQALYFTIGGAALGLSTYLAGMLYEDYGSGAYLAMAGLAGLGTLMVGLARLIVPGERPTTPTRQPMEGE